MCRCWLKTISTYNVLTYIYVYISSYIYAYIYAHIYIYIYMCIHIYDGTYMYIYIYIVKHNKCSDMANCSWTFTSRRVLLWEELISATCSWTASTTKVMPFKLPFNCLLWQQKKHMYEISSTMLKTSNIERWHIKCL